MLANLLLPAISGLRLIDGISGEKQVTLVMRMSPATAECPLCHRASVRIHSRSTRQIADRPWNGVPVKIHLRVRRFFCDNAECRRRIFTERLHPTIAPYARRTRRLSSLLEALGLALGGRLGAPLARRLGMPISPNTLVRLLRRMPESSVPTPRVLGVDDWAWPKGQTYGTLLVDLQRHQSIDLLADRSAKALADWLQSHPGVEVICRDRAGMYADGAQRGAPAAVQVADRFHLLQNLRDTLQRTLDRNQTHLQQVHLPTSSRQTVGSASTAETQAPLVEAQSNMPVVSVAEVSLPAESVPEAKTLTAAQRKKHASRTRREQRYAVVKQLEAEGLSRRAIARRLRLHRKTVTRYLNAGVFPERAQPPPKPSILDPYLPYLTQQLTAGQDNGQQLWRDICQQGYRGSRSLVSRWVAHHRNPVPAATPEHPRGRRRGRPSARNRESEVEPSPHLSARRAAWLLLSRPEDLADAERRALEQLEEICADVRLAHALAQEFAQMLRERRVGGLDRWVERAVSSGVPELRRFGEGLQRDRAAVRAAFSLPYSSGQVEGQINKLKLIKRSMFGRAKFDLLRRRMLATDTI